MKGRARIALGLLGFLLVATGVIWRRSVGIESARELRALEERRSELRAKSIQLENEIREAASRARLVPIAEQRLHMRTPSDSQVVILPKHKRAP